MFVNSFGLAHSEPKPSWLGVGDFKEMAMEVYELPPGGNLVAGIRVRVNGVLVGVYGTLKAARDAFKSPVNLQTFKGQKFPKSATACRWVASYGKEKNYSVWAALDEDGDDVFCIITGPTGYMYPGTHPEDVATGIAGKLASDYDLASSPLDLKPD
jgi:hypothetical protein